MITHLQNNDSIRYDALSLINLKDNIANVIYHV